MNDETIDFLLAFADDEHLMGQQHTEWIGVAPFLEEDLAFSSIGQDELGHAVLLYELILELQGIDPDDAAVDELAYRRTNDEYRSCKFVEYSTGDWAQALVRHWIYDTIEQHRWSLLADSTLDSLQAIAARASREETYHRRHANALLDTLLTDNEARNRLSTALEVLLPLVPSLLDPPPGERAAIKNGVTAGSTADLSPTLTKAIADRFDRNVSLAPATSSVSGRLSRSTDFAPLIGRMREVLDFDPKAVW